MKVLFLFTDFFPFGFGEPFLETEIHYLSRTFDKVFVVSTNTEDVQTRELPSNCEVYRFGRFRPGFMTKIRILAGLLRVGFYKEVRCILYSYRQRPTLLHIKKILRNMAEGTMYVSFVEHIVTKEGLQDKEVFFYSYWFSTLAYVVALLKGGTDCSYGICRAHGWDLYFERDQLNYLPFRRNIYESLDAIYFVSEHGKKYFEEKLGIRQSNKLRVSRLGVVNANPFNARQKGDGLRLLSCSSIIAVKRLDLLIEALSDIDDIYLSWIHIGDGKQGREIKLLAEGMLGKKKNILFKFLGQLRPVDVKEYYQTHPIDLFINVSSSEGVPVSIQEAMSYGIPVIATTVGGINEIVNDQNGILLPAYPRPKEIKSALYRFYFMGESEFISYQKNAYKTWQEKFNGEVNYSHFIQDLLTLQERKS